MAEHDDNERAGELVGKIPSGCCILTAQHDGRCTGILVSWIQQASFEPLLLCVAVRKGRPILELLEASRRCVLNLLGADPKPMFKHFGRGFRLDEPAFDGLSCRNSPYGVVLEDSIGYLECSIESMTEAGDHWLYLIHPSNGRVLNDLNPYVHIRKSAMSY